MNNGFDRTEESPVVPSNSESGAAIEHPCDVCLNRVSSHLSNPCSSKEHVPDPLSARCTVLLFAHWSPHALPDSCLPFLRDLSTTPLRSADVLLPSMRL